MATLIAGIPINEIWVGADMSVGLVLQDFVTKELISDATVTATVTKVANNGAVPNGSDIPLDPVSGQPGTYIGTLPHTMLLIPGTEYYLTVKATAAGIIVPFKQRRIAVYANGRAP